MKARRKKTIVIDLDGGLIQQIRGIPRNIRLEVRDYDVEGAGPDELTQDKDGNDYFETIWEHGDS